MSPSPKYRPDIDGLRAIAVLAVIIFHAFPEFMRGGFTGVDIFFVISGYLISSIILDDLKSENFSFTEFYARRIRRIFPALILVMVFAYIAGWFLLFANETMVMSRHIAGGAAFIANFTLWQEGGYFAQESQFKPMLHLWSLGVEEQFYLLWPLLLWLAHKKRWNSSLIVTLIAVASFGFNIFYISHNQHEAAFYFPQSRFWELMLGTILAIYRQHVFRPGSFMAQLTEISEDQRAGIQNKLSLLGAAIILFSVFYVAKNRYFPGAWALLPAGGALLIIMAGANAWFNRVILSNPVLVGIGLISYPLYLWHWPLLIFSKSIPFDLPEWQVKCSVLFISFLLAFLTYYFIERPIRFGARGKTKAAVLLIMMALIGGAALHASFHDVWPQRYSESMQKLIYRTHDYKDAYRQPDCFLEFNIGPSGFDACPVPPAQPDKPSILLWGDSHAAHLFPGLQAVYGDKLRIMQRTASGCQPIMGMIRDIRANCKDINDAVMHFIQNEKPDKIILAAMWDIDERPQLAETIRQLHQLGITDIDLVGPVPFWYGGLPLQLYKHSLENPGQALPRRMKKGFVPSYPALDDELRNFARQHQLRYLSPMGVLCNADGCLTRFGDTNDELTAWDQTHLTEKSSSFLISHFPSMMPRSSLTK